MAGANDSRGAINEANRYRAKKSRYSGIGAAGFISPFDAKQAHSFLSRPGEVSIVNPPASTHMPDFEIGVSWDNIPVVEARGLLDRFFKKKIVKAGVDLDLGCLYEMKDGRRGGMQAFGDQHGAFNEFPYVELSGDERRGDREGPDEIIRINGAHWGEIDRILIYTYIYKGAKNWDAVKPQIQVRVPDMPPMIVTLQAQKVEMAICAVAKLENIRGGIRMTSVLEYFHGHADMDRAFGFGLEWEQGRKDP